MNPVPTSEDLIFTDRGAWHGYTWGTRSLFDAVALDRGEVTSIFADRELVKRETYPDRFEAHFSGGEQATLYFLDGRTAGIATEGGVKLHSVGGPFLFQEIDDGYYHHVFMDGPEGAGENLSGLPRAMRWNWRQPMGDLRSAGIVPSPRRHPGFRAWDAWKLAAVLPTRLARQQIQAMFDHQRDDGMIPATVMRNSDQSNRRCSAPPLAAWACSRHPELLDEFRPALLRYHHWWEENRRPPGEKLLAYGGDVLEAAKTESGWDNATRYDGVEFRGGIQSVLSVDLNAYFCLEKRLLGIPDPELEELVRRTFFHSIFPGCSAFHDVTWPDHEPIRTLTAATWIPLWCGVADDAQAEAVLDLMVDPDHFNTPLPFSTVARSDTKFNPDGYWRGAVWFDHAAWAVEVLARYDREVEARTFARRLLEAPADWECYNPLTGRPARGTRPAVSQFAGTAAARWTLEQILES